MGRVTPLRIPDTSAWLVEALQLTGRWEPIAAPPDRPFTKERANLVRRAIVKRLPNLAARIRVWPYGRIDRAPESLTTLPEELMENLVYTGNPETRAVVRMNVGTGRESVLHHHVHHSPDGFSWGYSGSGPSELARCLLWDVLGYQPDPSLYQDFKAEVIAPLPQGSGWTMPIANIVRWLDARGVKVMTPAAHRFRELLAEQGYELTPKEILDVLTKAESLAAGDACPTCGHVAVK